MPAQMSAKQESNGPRVSDVATPIGGLGRYLTDRRIAIAQGSDGGQFLIRPDVVLVRTESDEERDELARFAKGVGARFAPSGSKFVSIRIGVEPEAVAGERRYSVAPVNALLEELKAFDVSPVHVYTGSNFAGSPFVSSGSVMGNPFVSSGGLSGSPFVSSGGVLGSPFVSSGVEPLNSATPAHPPTTLRKKIGLGSERRRPQVLVLDTGFAEKKVRPTFADLDAALVEHADWRSERDHDATDDDDEVDVDGNGRRELQSGHGTFVAGIVSLVCPDAQVHIDGALSSYGIGDDISAGEALERALGRSDDSVDIVVMSFGGYTENDAPPPLAGYIQDALDARRARAEQAHAKGDEPVPGLVFVAAAGNNGSPRLTFPAALPTVRSVGALGPAGRAYFSNFGGWVDACAPGVDVVSTYFSNYSEKIDPPPELLALHSHRSAGSTGSAPEGMELEAVVKKFDGWATWSGTSFSAPKVAAAIAHEMFVERVDAPAAWERLSHWEKFRYPDLGIVFNIH